MSSAVSPQLVIHIGDPKTGTTSIQQTLQEGKIRCETRRILPWKSYNAVSVADSLKPKGREKQGQKFSEVRDWLAGSDADIAVLSSEFFSSASPSQLHKTLKAHVPEWTDTVQVVGYARPHASRYLAMFIQQTKTGFYQGDFESFFSLINKNDSLNYAKRFGRWEKVFGDRFTLKPFIRSEMRGGDVVTDFASEILGSEPFAVDEIVETNIAVHLRALAGIRHLQGIFTTKGIAENRRGFFGRAIANDFLPLGPMKGEKPRLDRATAERLIEAYSEDAKALDSKFFGKPLMQDELQASLDKAGDTPINLDPAAYFSPQQMLTLDRLGAEIAELFLGSPEPWSIHNRSRLLGSALRPKQASRIEKDRAVIDGIDVRLAEVSDILRA